MYQPDTSRPHHGRERTCSHCGARVAQKAQTCLFCGASLETGPKRRIAVPWADLFLFALISGVLAFWWLRPPEPPAVREVAQVQDPEASPGPAAAPLLGLEREEPATPVPTPSATTQPVPTAAVQPTMPAAPVRHTVKAGDTVAAIAQRYGAVAKDIIQANGLSAEGLLRVGQELIIPLPGPTGGLGPTATPAGGALMYIVQSGDTVSGIADRFKSQIDWILAANKLKPTDFLRIGQALLVPLSATTPTPTPTTAPLPPTPTPTPEFSYAAPALLTPADAAVLGSGSEALLTWTSVGILGPDEWYVVTLRGPEKTRSIPALWTKSTAWRLPEELRSAGDAGTDFTWQVRVRKGSAEAPGRFLSPPGAQRRFTWR